MSEQPDVGQVVVDRRRTPFCFQTHAALDVIRAHYTGARRATALAIYLSFTEAANRHGGAAARGGFQAARKEVAESAGVSADTIDRYAGEFVDHGLLTIERRKAGSVNLPNIWILEEPKVTAGSGAPPGRTGAARGSRTGAALRARSFSEAKKQPKEEELSAPADGMTQTLVAQPLNADVLPPPLMKVEGRNLALDALAEVTGLSPGEPMYGAAIVALNGQTPKKGEAVMGINELAWQELHEHVREDQLQELRDDPAKWQEMLKAMIEYKASRYRAEMPNVFLTPKALRDWWLRLEKIDLIKGADVMSTEEILNIKVD